jgi:hypothetical protein
VALGLTWILDGLEVTLAGSIVKGPAEKPSAAFDGLFRALTRAANDRTLAPLPPPLRANGDKKLCQT